MAQFLEPTRIEQDPDNPGLLRVSLKGLFTLEEIVPILRCAVNPEREQFFGDRDRGSLSGAKPSLPRAVEFPQGK